MDEHHDLPEMASAGAGTSSRAAALDQPQMAPAAASPGAAATANPAPASSTAAAAGGGAGGNFRRVFDFQLLQDFVANHEWDKAEKQLMELIPVEMHPCLFIHIYEEWIADCIRKNKHRDAVTIFADKVSVLYGIKNDFVDEKNLKFQVNRLLRIANQKDPVKTNPVEKIMSALSDYMHLYLSSLLILQDINADRQSHLWRFAKRMNKPPRQKNPNFKCLACGTLFKDCPISKLRVHLDKTSGRTCSKMTRNLQVRFEGGERKGKTDLKSQGHGKVGRTKQNLVIQDNPPASEERTDNTRVAQLVEAVHSNAASLHTESAGKPLEPKVEKRLRAARDLLNKVLSQKSSVTPEEPVTLGEHKDGAGNDGLSVPRPRRARKPNPKTSGPLWV